MIFQLIASFFLGCLLSASSSFGNQTSWPKWLNTGNAVTLSLESDVLLFGRYKINAIQIEPVGEFAKYGPAVLGTIGKDGQFKPKFDVEYTEHGKSAILVDDIFVIDNNLRIKEKRDSRKIGSAKVLQSYQEVFLKHTRSMPYFDVPRQQFRMSDQYVQLSEPIEIDGAKVSVIYFEPFFSIHPGSQVYFGNLDSGGKFIDAPVNTRMWDYRSGGSVLIHLDTAKSKYLRITRRAGTNSAFISGEGIGSVGISALRVISDRVYFSKPSSKSSIMNCSAVLKSAVQ